MPPVPHAPPKKSLAGLLPPRLRPGDAADRRARGGRGARPPRLFRFAALLAVLGMLAGWMEVAVPDVHDGHGAAKNEPAWVQLAHDHAPALPGDPGHAPQSPHTCHCLHAHAPAMPARPDDPPSPAASDRFFSSTDGALASVAPDPHFRPPAA